MSRTILLILFFGVIVGNVRCYLIGRDDTKTKDILVNTDDEFEGDEDDVHSVMGFPRLTVEDGQIQRITAKPNNINELGVDNGVNGDRDDANGEKKCAAIGEFCRNHADCCTYSCLGYMKRCVS